MSNTNEQRRRYSCEQIEIAMEYEPAANDGRESSEKAVDVVEDEETLHSYIWH